MGNNGFIITHYVPGQLADGFVNYVVSNSSFEYDMKDAVRDIR